MNNENKVTLVVLLALLLCGGLIAGMYYLSGQLQELQKQSDALEQRIVNARANTQVLIEQKKVFTEKFRDLDNGGYNVKPVRDETEFFTVLREAAEDNQIEILSSRQQGVNQNGVTTMVFNLRGEYYNMLQLLAAWRNLPITVRLANLTMHRSGQGAASLGRIEAEMTVETVASQGNTSGRG